MAEPIKINVPVSELQFDLGGNIFTLSLADRSRRRINEQYREITQEELRNNQLISTLELALHEKLSHIRTNLSDSDAKKRESAISNDYDHKFKQAADNAEQIANTKYLPFVDTLFGEGSGDKVYRICGENIIAVNKVIAIVMTKLNNENDVSDYMSEYSKSLEKMKAFLEGGDAIEADGK